MIRNKTAIALFGLFIVLVCQSAVAQTNVILGVLEDSVLDTPRADYDLPHVRDVRLVFTKAGKEWQPYEVGAGYPDEVVWTIAFDGKDMGRVRSRKSGSLTIGLGIGQEEIISKTPVPTVGKRSIEFGGFTDQAVYRPLIAVSQPNFKDPELWKPRVLSPDVLLAAREQFRKKFPKLCQSGADEVTLKPLPYSDAAVKSIKSYAAKTGWKLVQLHLDNAIDCNDVEAGFEIDNPWFVIDSKGSVQYLDSGMFLVDAGDYDGDGKSELVFSIDSDNRGGYRIFYDDFKKKAEFEFTYH